MNGLKRILLAEDDEKDIALTLEALDHFKLANEVIITRNGEEALDYLYYRGIYSQRDKGNPAVMMLDIQMPKVSGLEVLKQIKSDENLKNIPAVILTSSKLEKDMVESYNSGVNAFVVKPVDFNEFINVVKELGLFWAVVNEPPLGSVK
jgi:CheY-like chemotaxis protein